MISKPQSPEEPAAAKAALRTEMRQRGRAMSERERSGWSQELCARLLTDPAWKQARRVGLFVPMPTEPSIGELSVVARATGREIALPRWNPVRGDYEFALATTATLVTGQFGIPEPGPEGSVIAANQLDLILVPGLAFTPDGRRLGRGRGFFDRLLAEVSAGRCGVAFDWQIVEELPTEAHDIRVDCVVTPGGRWPTTDRG
jgi:5-formyltetrahydrofolate cyclo-ligase